MHLQFVGCGDAFGSGGRFNTCFHVAGETVNFLIDCGASSLIALKRLRIDLHRIDAILITHFHADHCGGIPFFILDAQFGKRARPLTIAGPFGLTEWFERSMETAFPNSSQVQQKFDLHLVTLNERISKDLGALRVTPFPVVHGSSGGPFFAYRIEAEGRTVAYSGDTEWTDTLLQASRDADLFIVECYAYGKQIRNHLDLASLSANMPRIDARRIVLTHMSEDMLAHRHEIVYAAANDGMIVTL